RAVRGRGRVSRPFQRQRREGRFSLSSVSSAAPRNARRPAAPHPPRPRTPIPDRRQIAMSERPHHRRPATFKLDDASVVVVDPDEAGRPARGTVQVRPESDAALLPVTIQAPIVPPQRGLRWGTLFWIAVGGLIALGLGLAVAHLIEDLVSGNEGLGFIGRSLSIAAALAFSVVVARETFGLLRLAKIEKLH